MDGKERLDLGLDRLHQHPPGAVPQNREQRIVHEARSWPRQGDDSILLHGVSSRVTPSSPRIRRRPPQPPKSAIALRAHPGKQSLNLKRQRAGWDDGFLLQLVTAPKMGPYGPAASAAFGRSMTS